MHTNSKLIFQRQVLPRLRPNLSILEVGPELSFRYRHEYVKHFDHHGDDWYAADCYNSKAMQSMPESSRVPMTEYNIGAADNSFDVVISGQVIEHVRKPWLWLPELSRVARQLVIIISPITWRYHEAPVDCWRMYPEAMRALFEEAGLDEVLIKCLSLDGATKCQMGRARVCDLLSIGAPK